MNLLSAPVKFVCNNDKLLMQKPCKRLVYEGYGCHNKPSFQGLFYKLSTIASHRTNLTGWQQTFVNLTYRLTTNLHKVTSLSTIVT